MVDLEIAVENAKNFALRSIKDRTLNNLLLEEIDLSENEKFWLITLGWDDESIKPNSAMAAALGYMGNVDRDYRVFYVDRNSGNVMKMKFRE